MKKILIAIFALSASYSSYAESKFDARGEMIANEYRNFVKDPSSLMMNPDRLPFDTRVVSRSGISSTVTILLEDGVSRDEIEALGFNIVTGSRSVLVVEGLMDNIIKLAESDLVKSVEFAKDVDTCLDVARKRSGVDAIHAGSDGLPQAYTGKGVITGIFDTGFYPDHYNFKDADGNCRITNFWWVKNVTGTAITHYDTPAKVIGITGGTDSSSSSHGTHTLGCMAGYCYKKLPEMISYDQETSKWTVATKLSSRYGVASPWYGSAKESEIVVGAGPLYDQSIMAGIQKVADYINASGKPGVINLSIGSVIGPRDGSDVFCTFLSEVGEKIPVCVSAGNDGDSKMTLNGNSYKFFLVPVSSKYTASEGILDFWSSNGSDFTITAVVYDTASNQTLFSSDIKSSDTKKIIIGNSTYSNVTVKDASFDKAFKESSIQIQAKKSTTNNRYNIYMEYKLAYNATTNTDKTIVFGFIVKGAANQRIDVSNKQVSGNGELQSLGIAGWSDGNADMSINSMACGKNNIAVGAWNTRNEWGITTQGASKIYYSDTPEEDGYGLGDVAGYSSYGQLCDGRKLPDFCAPGTGIISSVSTPGKATLAQYTYPTGTYTATGDTRTDMWGLMQGTSMASPFAAGVIALWLEADPTLTPAEIKKIATETCTTDDYTSKPGMSLRWGAGKINALAGIKKILGIAGINDITVDADDHLQVTPSGYRNWQVYLSGASRIDLKLYSMSGQIVASSTVNGDEAELDASSVDKGVYILNVNGKYNVKIAIN